MKHNLEKNTAYFCPSWQNVIDNLDSCFRRSPDDILYLPKMGMVVHNVLHHEYMQTLDLGDELSHIHNGRSVSVHTYISFSKDSETFGKHRDDVDVYFLNAIGETEFTVWEDDVEYVYTLEPGDLLYIPKGLWHSTRPLTPRVGLSYGIE
jgi:ribosomal protein L16 Arg81 hydroxylase